MPVCECTKCKATETLAHSKAIFIHAILGYCYNQTLTIITHQTLRLHFA